MVFFSFYCSASIFCSIRWRRLICWHNFECNCCVAETTPGENRGVRETTGQEVVSTSRFGPQKV